MQDVIKKIKEKKLLKILIISILVSFFVELFIFNVNTVINETYNEELVILDSKNLKYENGYYITEKNNSYIILKNNKKHINKISFEYESDKNIKYNIVTKTSNINNTASNIMNKTTRKVKVKRKENIKIEFYNKNIKLRSFRASNELLINYYRLFFMIVTVFVSIILTKYYRVLIKKKELLFLLIGSLFGLLLVFVYPISTVTNINFGKEYKSYEEIKSYNDNIVNNSDIKVSNESIDEKVYSPYKTINRLTNSLGISKTSSVILMRIINLIIYLSLIYLAIKITPYLKKLTFVIGILPSSMSLITSLSYNFLSIASLILGFAAFLKLQTERKIERKYLIIFILGILLASIINPLYSPMFLLILLLKDKKFEDEKTSRNIKILSVILFVITLLLLISYLVNYKTSKDISVISQFNYILNNPIDYIILIIKTTIYNISEMFLGYNTISLMGRFNTNMVQFNLSNFILLALIIYLVYKDNVSRELVDNKIKKYIIIILLIIWILTLTISYLTLTPITNSEILGLINNMFIPLIIPLAIIFMSGNKEEIKNETIIYILPIIILIYSISQIIFTIYK